MKIAHVLCEVLSLAVVGEDGRSVVQCRVLRERGRQATGSVIVKVITVVALEADKIPLF